MSNQNLKALRYIKNNPEKVVKKRRSNKLELIKYKGGKCQKCGYDKPILNAYHFHHLDPNNKLFTISSRMSHNLASLKKEADKCILLCSNCHAEIHNQEYIIKIEQRIMKINSWSDLDIITMSLRKRREVMNLCCRRCGEVFRSKRENQQFCSTDCFHKYRRKTTRPNKKMLLALVSQHGYSGTGRMFNVSDNCIRKWIGYG
jgi:hypothetical protein